MWLVAFDLDVESDVAWAALVILELCAVGLLLSIFAYLFYLLFWAFCQLVHPALALPLFGILVLASVFIVKIDAPRVKRHQAFEEEQVSQEAEKQRRKRQSRALDAQVRQFDRALRRFDTPFARSRIVHADGPASTVRIDEVPEAQDVSAPAPTVADLVQDVGKGAAMLEGLLGQTEDDDASDRTSEDEEEREERLAKREVEQLMERLAALKATCSRPAPVTDPAQRQSSDDKGQRGCTEATAAELGLRRRRPAAD